MNQKKELETLTDLVEDLNSFRLGFYEVVFCNDGSYALIDNEGLIISECYEVIYSTLNQLLVLLYEACEVKDLSEESSFIYEEIKAYLR